MEWILRESGKLSITISRPVYRVMCTALVRNLSIGLINLLIVVKVARAAPVEKARQSHFSLTTMLHSSNRKCWLGISHHLTHTFCSIANVILQAGQTVPDWITKLPKPSRMKRKAMGKIKRPEIVNQDRGIGRQNAIKKQYG